MKIDDALFLFFFKSGKSVFEMILLYLKIANWPLHNKDEKRKIYDGKYLSYHRSSPSYYTWAISNIISAENLVSYKFYNSLNDVFFEYSWLKNYFRFHILDKGITNIFIVDLYYRLSDSADHSHDSKIIFNKIIHSLILTFSLTQKINLVIHCLLIKQETYDCIIK